MLEISEADLKPVDFDPFVETAIVTLPLTVQQSEVWVESQMGPEASCAFNQCFVLHLQGPLSVELMQSALNHVVRRHGALRACFEKEGNKQRILPQCELGLALQDLSGLGEKQRQDAIERILDRMRDIRLSEEHHGPPGARHFVICPGQPRNPLSGSSALMRTSIAAPFRFTFFCLSAKGCPSATLICSLIRSMPVTCSVTGCSTCIRALTSMK